MMVGRDRIVLECERPPFDTQVLGDDAPPGLRPAEGVYSFTQLTFLRSRRFGPFNAVLFLTFTAVDAL